MDQAALTAGCVSVSYDKPAVRRPGRARRPDLVRLVINARSNWATAPSTFSENMPCGVAVSIGSRRLRKCARRPQAVRSRPAGGRPSAPDDRAGPPPGFRRRASTGRPRPAPEACCSRIVVQPAARNSSSCGSVPWSSMETRAWQTSRPRCSRISSPGPRPHGSGPSAWAMRARMASPAGDHTGNDSRNRRQHAAAGWRVRRQALVGICSSPWFDVA